MLDLHWVAASSAFLGFGFSATTPQQIQDCQNVSKCKAIMCSLKAQESVPTQPEQLLKPAAKAK